MKFREEYKLIFPKNPDIIVIQECEDLKTINFDLFSNTPSDIYWIGDNPKKGLGVITFNDFKISLYDDYDNSYKYILPLEISRNDITYNLIGVWTQIVGKHNKDHKNYIRQVVLSMEKYDSFIKPDNTIIIGDFNSNLKWEKPRRHIDYDHKYVVEELQKKGIESSYHYYFKEEQGDETRPTFFYHHKEEKTFHLDFCFLSKNLIDRLNKVKVGKYEDWIKYSDHVPMIIEIQKN
jgi:exodeoxyribonuclease III